jgi:hypothetical protein
MTQMHTKYHKLFGSRILLDINGECADEETTLKLVRKDYVQRLVEECSQLPRYVIQKELMDSIHSSAMIKSLEAMIKANAANHLPFPSIIVEFEEQAELGNEVSTRITRVRQFVWLSEVDKNIPATHVWANPIKDQFTATCWTLIDDTQDRALVISPLVSTCSMMTSDQAKNQNIPSMGSTGTAVQVMFGPQVRESLIDKELEKQVSSSYGISHAFSPLNEALCAMILLLHTKGVVQDRIEVPPKLNKSRVESGKIKIQDHVLVRIGHVYSRSGEKIEYNKSGRTMPVHWRAGHYRNQRFGTKLSKSYELWIEPMLINYVEGDAPTPKTKEVTI